MDAIEVTDLNEFESLQPKSSHALRVCPLSTCCLISPLPFSNRFLANQIYFSQQYSPLREEGREIPPIGLSCPQPQTRHTCINPTALTPSRENPSLQEMNQQPQRAAISLSWAMLRLDSVWCLAGESAVAGDGFVDVHGRVGIGH